MIKFLMVSTFIGAVAFGSTPDPEAFCRDYLALRQKQSYSRPTPDQTLKLLFHPRSLIRARQWDRPVPLLSPRDADKTARKVAYVMLNAPKWDDSVVRAVRETQQRIRRLPIVQDLARIETLNACRSVIKQDSFGYARMSDYLDQFKNAEPHLEAKRQWELRTLVEKKLAAFARKGWEIRFPRTYFEFMSELERERDIREAMLISHADVDGKLYDASGNAVPKGFLLNLPVNLRKLILFSCHTESVLDHYEAIQASSTLDIHYPELRDRHQNLYQTSIPVVALRGMLVSAEAGITTLSEPDRACKLDVVLPEASGRYEVLLENRLIGILDRAREKSIPFDCSLLGSGKLIFKLHHAEGEARLPPRVSEMRLTTPGTGMVLLRVKEFVSSDGTRHIQTIGTTGGHP